MSDLINRQDVIDALLIGCEILRRVLDDASIVGQDREKFSWGLGLIESFVDDINELPSAETDLIAKIQIGINATNTNDSYSCGMRNGMRLCMSLVDDKEPLFENCPSAQPDPEWRKKHYEMAYNQGYVDACKYYENLPEQKKGKWIATYSDCDGDVWVSWKCSNCGYVRKKGWKYTDDGKKPDALFCEMCNADMRGEQDDTD